MIDFLKYRYVCAVFSAILIATFVGGFIYRGGFSYSVDFTGGTQLKVRFDKPVSADALRDALSKGSARDWKGIQVVEFSPTEFRVRVKNVDADMQALAQHLLEDIAKADVGNHVEMQSIDSVGAAVGEALKKKSIYAIFWGLLAMLAYITIRFKFAYAMGAVLALAHDALVIGAVFIILGKEISIDVIAAILAILGYSVNDTIVIFARIRENLGIMPTKPLTEVVNTSLNQTLRRTILTSAATLLVVLALFVLGGDALRDFSLALLLGIIFGTYSSIYIASPIMMFFTKPQ